MKKRKKEKKIKAGKSCVKAGVRYLFIYLSSPGSLMKP